MGEGYAKLSDILVAVQLWDDHGYLLLVSVLPGLYSSRTLILHKSDGVYRNSLYIYELDYEGRAN